MEGLRKITVVVMMWVVTMEMVNGFIVYVGGGKETWRPNVNFSEWSSHQHVYVGDWIYFGFDKNLYNVLQVNKTSYESCNDDGFIKNITQGGRDVFQVTEKKTYYFLCGKGFCFSGMKVAINVEDVPSPTKSPSQSHAAAGHGESASSSDLGSHVIFLVVLTNFFLAWPIFL